MSRAATGLRRKLPVPVHFDGDEDEYVALKAWDSDKMSKAEFLRSGVLHRNWRSELIQLREKHKNEPRKFRREP